MTMIIETRQIATIDEIRAIELREENRRLRQNNRELRAGSAGRDAEVSALNDEIARSRRTEEQWRRAYVEDRKGRRPDEDPRPH